MTGFALDFTQGIPRPLTAENGYVTVASGSTWAYVPATTVVTPAAVTAAAEEGLGVIGSNVALPSGATTPVVVLEVPAALVDGGIRSVDARFAYGTQGGAADTQAEDVVSFTVARAGSLYTLRHSTTKSGPDANPGFSGSLDTTEGVGYQVEVVGGDVVLYLLRDMTVARWGAATVALGPQRVVTVA